MASAGVHVLRCAPWRELAGAAGLAAGLLALAVLACHESIGMIASVLGLSACGSCAAYTLDEFAVGVADASPTSRPRRLAWRLPIVLAPAAIALTGLAALGRLAPALHPVLLVPFVVGAIAIGVSIAAAFRRAGWASPGDVAAVTAFLGLALLAAANPFERWVSIAPLHAVAHPGRTVVLWLVMVNACVVITTSCARDPGRARTPR